MGTRIDTLVDFEKDFEIFWKKGKALTIIRGPVIFKKNCKIWWIFVCTEAQNFTTMAPEMLIVLITNIFGSKGRLARIYPR